MDATSRNSRSSSSSSNSRGQMRMSNRNGRFGGQKTARTVPTASASASASASAASSSSSLIHLCRMTVVNNLERFPPESLGVLDEAEWSTMIRFKHSLTAPKSGKGGLDGTGRLTAAISDRFMSLVEGARGNEHLRDSVTADTLIWKDCVNRRFTALGISRPVVLHMPWPLRLQAIETATQVLLNNNTNTHNASTKTRIIMSSSSSSSCPTTTTTTTTATTAAVTSPIPLPTLEVALQQLEQSPMNTSLLKATGVGKTLKKICKRFKQDQGNAAMQARLEALLEKWKAMVATNATCNEKPAASLSDQEFNTALGSPSVRGQLIDWHLLETQASSWRKLFAILVRREEARRSLQGQRISNIRKNLNHVRPKIVKVVPSKNQSTHQRILNHASAVAARGSGSGGGGSLYSSRQLARTSSASSKIKKLRQEALVSSSRQHGRSPAATAAAASSSSSSSSPARTSGFAAAVAASGSSTGKKMSFGQQQKRKGNNNEAIIMKSSGKRIRR